MRVDNSYYPVPKLGPPKGGQLQSSLFEEQDEMISELSRLGGAARSKVPDRFSIAERVVWSYELHRDKLRMS